jgi:ABC-type multidrug transport system fused ATPase/permease subunit
VIAQRLSKLQNNESNSTSSHDNSISMTSPRSLHDRKTILFINKDGDIIFHASKFFDILDKNNDGMLSYEEINAILCLEESQLQAFIASMRGLEQQQQQQHDNPDKVSRSTFQKYFLDALANASQLQPTEEEAGEIFDVIAEEVGATPSGEIESQQLFYSYLSTFLNDEQIYGIITGFKRRGAETERHSIDNTVASTRRFLAASMTNVAHSSSAISREAFVKLYPSFLSEVTDPHFVSARATLTSIRGGLGNEKDGVGGLDVAFEDLTLAVQVGKTEKVVVNKVSGRLRSNTMTAVLGGSGSGKSSLLNALCGRAFYGTTTGKVFINGNESKIENHKSSIGFVPQEDIVYADLTVRENLVRAAVGAIIS